MAGMWSQPVGGRSGSNVVRVPKAAELVAEQLRDQIVRGELQDGDSLPPENELMARYGVSRPTLREAFRVLESEALISVRRGARGGARIHAPVADVAARYAGFVLEHQGTSMADLYAARTVIETPCVFMLARHRTRADLELLWRSVEESEAEVDHPDRFIRAHTDFHALVIRLCRNETLTLINQMVGHLIDRANWLRVERDPGPSTVQASHRGSRAHRRLVEYIEARDAPAAEALWRTHLVEAADYLLEEPGAQDLVELLG